MRLGAGLTGAIALVACAKPSAPDPAPPAEPPSPAAAASAAVAPSAPDASSPSAPPSATLPPVRDWSQRVDFDALRQAYGESDDFSARCESERPVTPVPALVEGEQWAELLALTTPWLEQCPVDIDFHGLRQLALAELGRPDEAARHEWWRRGLVESVLRSGDGSSVETAWVVISVAEEYALLRALGLEPRGQQLVDGRIDALTVSDGVEEETVYFAPDAHFRRLRENLRPSATD